MDCQATHLHNTRGCTPIPLRYIQATGTPVDTMRALVVTCAQVGERGAIPEAAARNSTRWRAPASSEANVQTLERYRAFQRHHEGWCGATHAHAHVSAAAAGITPATAHSSVKHLFLIIWEDEAQAVMRSGFTSSLVSKPAAPMAPRACTACAVVAAHAPLSLFRARPRRSTPGLNTPPSHIEFLRLMPQGYAKPNIQHCDNSARPEHWQVLHSYCVKVRVKVKSTVGTVRYLKWREGSYGGTRSNEREQDAPRQMLQENCYDKHQSAGSQDCTLNRPAPIRSSDKAAI